MNEYQAKTTNAKLAKLKHDKELKKASAKKTEAQHKELLASISSLQANISTLEASLSANGTLYTESQKDLAQNFTTLREILQAGLNVTNIKDIEQAKEIIVSNLKDLPKPVINTTKTEIPKWLASEKGIATLNDNVIKVVQALIDLEANIKPSQEAENFVPFRRVIRNGNRLVFDDTDWASRGGGGGSTTPFTGLTDAELRASAVPVSMSSDIEIGAVELKNGTDDTRATVTAGNALKVDGSAVTQPVSGTVTATAQPGVDIGDVTINNTTATAVPVQPPLSGFLNVSIDQTGNNNAVDVLTMPTVTTTEAVPTTILNGNKNVTTAGTRVTLAGSTACKSVTIKAKITNTGTIYVGDTSVASSNGFALAAGETLSLDIANLSTINLDASVSGEGVTYAGVN